LTPNFSKFLYVTAPSSPRCPCLFALVNPWCEPRSFPCWPLAIRHFFLYWRSWDPPLSPSAGEQRMSNSLSYPWKIFFPLSPPALEAPLASRAPPPLIFAFLGSLSPSYVFAVSSDHVLGAAFLFLPREGDSSAFLRAVFPGVFF